jgi:hypothetical protein
MVKGRGAAWMYGKRGGGGLLKRGGAWMGVSGRIRDLTYFRLEDYS